MTDISRTRRVYDAFGRTYHEKRGSPEKNFWNLFIDTPAMSAILKPIVGRKRVLDAGCGSGIFTAKLSAWGSDVTGCDISKTLIGIARNENPGIAFIVCDAQRTPFPAGDFDIVSSNLMLHYLKDPTPFFREMWRVLRPGGHLIFSFHHPFNECLGELRLGTGIDDASVGRISPYFHNRRYTWTMADGTMRMISYHHTFTHITTSLRDAGFVIELIEEPRPQPKTRKYSPRGYDRTMRHPSFCIIKARKEGKDAGNRRGAGVRARKH